MAIKDWFNFKQKPLATSVSKATSGGTLYSEQAIDKMNVFFDNLIKFDTDEVFSNAGLTDHAYVGGLFGSPLNPHTTGAAPSGNWLNISYTNALFR